MDLSVEDVAGVPWQFLRNSAFFSLYRDRIGTTSRTVLIASTKDDNPNPENIQEPFPREAERNPSDRGFR
jgi:hypothetical protein